MIYCIMSILNYGNLSYSSVEPDLYSVIDFNYFHRCVESSIPSAFSDSEVSYLNWLSDLIVVKSVPIVMKNLRILSAIKENNV